MKFSFKNKPRMFVWLDWCSWLLLGGISVNFFSEWFPNRRLTLSRHWHVGYIQHIPQANSVYSCNSTRGRGFTVRVSDIPSHSIHHVYSHFTRRRPLLSSPLLSWRTRDTFMAQASVAQAAHNVNVFMNAELMWKAPHGITTRVTRLTVTRNGVIQDFRLADLRKLIDPRYRWCWAWELSGGLRPSTLSPGLNHSTPRASALLRGFTKQDLR